MPISRLLRRGLALSLVFLATVLLLNRSDRPPADLVGRLHVLTGPLEFNYVSWTLEALGLKLGQAALGANKFISSETQRQLPLEALALTEQIWQSDAKLNEIYADPNIPDPQAASSQARQERDKLIARREQIAPLAEASLQDQVGEIVAEMGLAVGGQAIPPVLYHTTHLPWALIVSPRHEIRQAADISLIPEMTVDRRAALEDQVDRQLDVSSLVVGIGGVGLYPTMIYETTDINTLSEVVAHEWVHNFLTLRPLGASYLKNPELRIMNETAANIAGKEIGRRVVERYYPGLLPPPPAPPAPAGTPQAPVEPPAFDFNKEMHATRLRVDELLAQGKVKEAEDYMEQRRIVFWEHGYHLRKLNQAFFAFYGAYADEPVGAAGADPVGAAVRALRAQSPTLEAFLKRIAWMSSFEQLQQAVQGWQRTPEAQSGF